MTNNARAQGNCLSPFDFIANLQQPHVFIIFTHLRCLLLLSSNQHLCILQFKEYRPKCWLLGAFLIFTGRSAFFAIFCAVSLFSYSHLYLYFLHFKSCPSLSISVASEILYVYKSNLCYSTFNAYLYCFIICSIVYVLTIVVILHFRMFIYYF